MSKEKYEKNGIISDRLQFSFGSLIIDPIPWAIFVCTSTLDQFSKLIVIVYLDPGESIPKEGFFRITHAWNTGTAFSLLTGQGEFLTIVSLVAVIGLYFVYRRMKVSSFKIRSAFGLLFGGAVGNLIDRFRLGHVTDFIDIGPWPIFNVADSAIVTGIAILVFLFWISPRSNKIASFDNEKSAGIDIIGSDGDVEQRRNDPS